MTPTFTKKLLKWSAIPFGQVTSSPSSVTSLFTLVVELLPPGTSVFKVFQSCFGRLASSLNKLLKYSCLSLFFNLVTWFLFLTKWDNSQSMMDLLLFALDQKIIKFSYWHSYSPCEICLNLLCYISLVNSFIFNFKVLSMLEFYFVLQVTYFDFLRIGGIVEIIMLFSAELMGTPLKLFSAESAVISTGLYKHIVWKYNASVIQILPKIWTRNIILMTWPPETFFYIAAF